MGFKFFIGEIQAQANQASRMNHQVGQAIASLQTSIRSFLSAPLSSKAYDSAKNYFMAVYTPLCQSAIMTGEALESANKRLLSDYQGMVSGIDTIEDEILEQIARFEAIKRDIEYQMNTAKTMRPDLERRYINACEIIDKRQEKLRKFHKYNAHSATIFSDYEACEAEFNRGLNEVANCKAWNPATGTFDMTRLNMSWAKPINERWQARAKELENRAKAKRDNWEKQVKADGLKLQSELDKRKYMLVDINGTKRWMWVIDPNHITQEDFRVNKAYELWLKNQIELHGRDAVLGKEEPDYLTKLAIELRDGKNYDTGKPLTDLEKAQRWATVASMIAVGGIAGYYANHPLTADQITLKREPITGEKNGKKYMLDRNKSTGNYGIKKPKVPKIPVKKIDSLPQNVKNSYKKYSKSGWSGNVAGQTPGTKAGSSYKNRDGKLPTTDLKGNKITYQEFDVNNKSSNGRRDSERFIKGSDGNLYYTDNHYDSFVRIE